MTETDGQAGNPFMAGLLSHDGYDPDDLPLALPDGVISFLGSTWFGSSEAYPILDMKVSLNGETIKAMLTTDMAREVITALVRAIDAAERSEPEPPTPSPPAR